MTEDLGSAALDLGAETDTLRASLADLSRLGEAFGRTLTRSFASAIIEGRKLSDVLRSLALSLANRALSAALRPLGNLVGSLFQSAQGNVVSGGRILPFAEGGVVNSPVLFPLRGGAGLMGEAGPEAILPLARGSDGKLGVRGGGRNVSITVNIAASDAESFRQSQSQIAALITRAAERGMRNL
jgi:lambda family phage tail tape measure protein